MHFQKVSNFKARNDLQINYRKPSSFNFRFYVIYIFPRSRSKAREIPFTVVVIKIQRNWFIIYSQICLCLLGKNALCVYKMYHNVCEFY